jgi:hypothetical protein
LPIIYLTCLITRVTRGWGRKLPPQKRRHLLTNSPVTEMLECYPVAGDPFPISYLLPLRGDGCGDYDCLVMGPGLAENSVVFWDHEIPKAPAYFLGSSLLNYLDMWSDKLIHRYLPDGREDERFVPPRIDHWPWIGEAAKRHPWPFDEEWMARRDPAIRDLLASAEVRKWLLRQDT